MQFFSTVCAVMCMALLVGAELERCSRPAEGEANYLTTEAIGCNMNVSREETQAIRSAKTTDDYQRAVKLSCDQHDAYTECMEGLKAEARACLKGFEQDTVLLDLENKAADFEATCVDDGTSFAILREEQDKSYDPHSASGTDVFAQCRLDAPSVVSLTINMNEDPNHGTLYDYRLMRQTVACLESHRGQGKDALVDAGKVFMAHLMDRVKCFDQEKHYILCKTIVDNTTHSSEEH